MMKIYHDDTGCYTKFEQPGYYIDHAGWYVAIMILLGMVAFDLGFVIGFIW
jgi:hypothetical protein